MSKNEGNPIINLRDLPVTVSPNGLLFVKWFRFASTLQGAKSSFEHYCEQLNNCPGIMYTRCSYLDQQYAEIPRLLSSWRRSRGSRRHTSVLMHHDIFAAR